jgi:hypothetical protein
VLLVSSLQASQQQQWVVMVAVKLLLVALRQQ